MLSKLLTLIVMPLGIGGLLILLGALGALMGRRGLGVAAVLVGLAWVWVWALPVASDWLRLSLEARYPPAETSQVPSAGAILVLGGGVRGIAPPRQSPDLGAAADRVWHGAVLFHAGKAPLVVLSGGTLPWRASEGPEAEAMRAFIRDLGVPEDRVVLEGGSGTTFENARETARMLKERGIERVLLVTSALHMRRAMATFSRAGIEVIPAPTDHEVPISNPRTLLDWLPDATALEGSTRAFKEYLGLWVYRMRGWAD